MHMRATWNAYIRWGAQRRHDVPIQFGTLAISSRTEESSSPSRGFQRSAPSSGFG